MNSTKWEEIRVAMYQLEPTPAWRTLDVENGYLSRYDAEWFYHFKQGGYETIEWVEIKCETGSQREDVLRELVRIHVPGEETSDGFKVFGYVVSGENVEYLAVDV